MQNSVIDNEIIKWAATRMDDVVLNPRDYYYPFDVVADAYEHGLNKGQHLIKENLRERYYNTAKLSAEAFTILLNKLTEKNYKAHKLFLKHNYRNTIIMISVDEVIHESNEFIDFAYNEAIRVEQMFRDKELDIEFVFLDEKSDFDLAIFRNDGFHFIYDLDSKVSL